MTTEEMDDKAPASQTVAVTADAAPDWKGFGEAIMDEWWWHYDVDADYKFDLARKFNILREIPGGFNPEVHEDELSEAKAGDPWYEMNRTPSALTAERDALAAENARLTEERDAARAATWDGPNDREDHLTLRIKAASADKYRYWSIYPLALAAVSNRHSKFALCHLTAYLMGDAERLRDALAAAHRYIDRGHYQMARNITRAALASKEDAK